MFQPGDSVEAQCGKCKGVTRHAVVVVERGEAMQVQCTFCGSRHKFKPKDSAGNQAARARKTASGPKKATGGKKATKAAQASAAILREWEDAVAAADPTQAKPYSMNSAFEEGDLVDHKKFGMGIVSQVIVPDKMEILFRDGIKLLRCNLQSS